MKQILVLAEPADAGARAVAAVLAARHGTRAVLVASGREVAFAERLVYRAERHDVSSEVALAGGARLARERIGAVLCRVAGAEPPWALRGRPSDVEYARGEAFALLLAWLTGLGRPIVNAPTATGLAAPGRTQFQWLALAGGAGLPVVRLRHTTSARAHARAGFRTLRLGAVDEPVPAVPIGRRPATCVEPLSGPPLHCLVVGDRVEGPIPVRLHAPCRRLAASAACGLLGLELRSGPSGPVLVAVDPVPPLDRPGEPDAVADQLEHLAGAA